MPYYIEMRTADGRTMNCNGGHRYPCVKDTVDDMRYFLTAHWTLSGECTYHLIWEA